MQPRMHDDIQIITFDAGGTLLYAHPSVGAIYSRVMAGHDIHLSPESLDLAFKQAWRELSTLPKHQVGSADEKDWWHRLVIRVLRDLDYHGDTEAVFEELWLAFAEPDHWRTYPGVVETLTGLAARGYRLAILSNWDVRLRPLLGRLALDRHFEHLIISSEVGIEKPDVGIFRHAEQLFAAPPSAFLHVGDSDHHDGGGARAATWRVALVEHGHAQVDGRMRCLTELLDQLPGPAAQT